jgi:DASH complex subunit DAD4
MSLYLPHCRDTDGNKQEKLNEAIAVLNGRLQEINVQNMNVELVAQMFKNYQANCLFHLEAVGALKDPSA